MISKLIYLIKDEGLVNSLSRLINKIFNHLRGWLYIDKSATVGKNLKIIGRNDIRFGISCGLGNSCRIEAHARYLEQVFSPCITFGNNCSFGDYLHIGSISKITIGNNVLAGSNILIIDHYHGNIFNVGKEDFTPPALRELISHGDINIGNNVLIGDGVRIFSGADIGDGCILAADSVVSKKIPPFSLCTGHNDYIS